MSERRRPRRYKVALLGAFGIDNFGNDVTLDAAMDSITRSIAAGDIVCICSVPEYASSRFGIESDYLHGRPTPRRWSTSPSRAARVLSRAGRELARSVSAYRRMRHVELLLVAGTGALDDQHIGPLGLPLDTAIWCVAARAAGARVAIVSTGAGPISSPVSRLLLRAAAGTARYVSYRDQASRDYMRSIGRNVDHDVVVPDLAFGLPEASIPPPTSLPERSVAVGVLWNGNWQARPGAAATYQSRLIDLIAGLWDEGCRVTLLIGDRADTDGREELLAALAVRHPQEFGSRLEVPRLGSFDDVLRAMAGCTSAVVSRYHHLVAALMTSTPLVSLEYGFKNRALMDAVGLGEHCLEVNDFDPSDVVRRVEKAEAVGAVGVRPILAGFRAQVGDQYTNVLRSFLSASARRREVDLSAKRSGKWRAT